MSGTLEQRYEIYVRCMTEIGKPVKTFDEWLDS